MVQRLASDTKKLPTGCGIVHTQRSENCALDLTLLLNAAGLAGKLAQVETILIKPNLVEALQPPITTPVALAAGLIRYLQNLPGQARIIIGEGTGSRSYDTDYCFDVLGYTQLAEESGIALVDLNTAGLVKRKRDDCQRWPELYFPALLEEAFIISLPVLKAHSLAGVTLTMKNMMGCMPPYHYQQGGHWRKSAFHQEIDAAIFELNRYRTPDFSLLDATVGMGEAHLWGAHCQPAVARLAASSDPVALDSYGCSLLGRDWRNIGHIAMAHNILGLAEPIDIREVSPLQ